MVAESMTSYVRNRDGLEGALSDGKPDLKRRGRRRQEARRRSRFQLAA